MSQSDVLRAIVAKLGGTQPERIGADFSLQSPALKSSIRRAALVASIRRQLGINCPAAHTVQTFAELEQAVLGAAAAPPADAASVPAPTVSVPISSPMPPSAADGLPAAIRCGVDIEIVADLPAATDYREHEFYRDTFSPKEIAYCARQENPRMHFAGRWCVKEALYKCDPALRSARLAEIEVVRSDQGEISLVHHRDGGVRLLPHAASISHTNTLAVAVVVRGAGARPPSPGLRDAPAGLTESGATVPIPPGSTLPLLSALAWLLAIGVSVFALVRSFH